MSRFAFFLMSAALLTGADDPWSKVQALKSRAELRIYKTGAREPLMTTLDEANEERIVVVIKNKQIAIAKEEIDRLDARTVVKEPRRLVKETTTKQTDPDTQQPPGQGSATPGESVTTSAGFSVSSRPGFETVYRRPTLPPKK